MAHKNQENETQNGKRASFKNSILLAGIAGGALILIIGFNSSQAVSQTAKAKGVQQKIVPAKVNYWMDLSNGGRSFIPAMPFGFGGGGGNNHFGDAYNGSPGKHADLAILHKDFPRAIEANQAIPNGLRLGRSLALIPTPVTPSGPRVPDERREIPDEPPKPPEGNFKLSFYWGCGANVRAGQPKVIQIRNGQVAAYNAAMQGRAERDRGAGQFDTASRWPNHKDKRDINASASMVGNHSLSGANIPASMSIAIDNARDFMGDLGLSSSGDKAQNLTLNWNNIGARAYFINAFGMSGTGSNNMEMVIWSSADVPDPGHGLLNYLSGANIAKWLQERALLPPSQTSCVVPRGIFANSQMIMARGIGHGDETNLVHPARPIDPNIPWIQEWTARIRNKSMSTLMVGMPSMGAMMGANEGENPPNQQCANNQPQPKSKGIGGLGGLGGIAARAAMGSMGGRGSQTPPPNNCPPNGN